MSIIYSSGIKLTISELRGFDIDIRSHTRQINLCDIEIIAKMPNIVDHDLVIVPIRETEHLNKTKGTDKEDSPSFVQIYESQEDSLIQSVFVTPDLKSLEPISKRIGKPLGRFSTITTLTGNDLSAGTSEYYFSINFNDLSYYKDMIVAPEGFFALICHNKLENHPNNHTEMLECFDFNNIYTMGITDSTHIFPTNFMDNYCTMFFCIIYIPLSGTWYFGINGNDACEIEVNGQVVASKYGSGGFLSNPASGSIDLEKGYYPLIIRHEETTGGDGVKGYVKHNEGDSWTNLIVDDIVNNLSMVAYTSLYNNVEEISSEENFVVFPDNIENIQTSLLFLNYYLPVAILARQGNNLFDFDFKKMYYNVKPKMVTCKNALNGFNDVNNLLNDKTLPYPSNQLFGVEYDPSYPIYSNITFTYNNRQIDSIEITEYPSFLSNDFTEDNLPTKLVLTIKDGNGFFYASERIITTYFDETNSVNVDVLENIGNSTTIIKKQKQGTTIISFKKPLIVSEIQIYPIFDDEKITKWGAITSLHTTLSLSNNVSMMDSTGKLVPAHSQETEAVTVRKYDLIGTIPAVFKPYNLPGDIKRSSELIMFCLDVAGNIPDFDTYGSVYTYKNDEIHLYENLSIILSTYRNYTDKQNQFNCYNDYEKTNLLDWAYIGHDINSNHQIVTDYQSFTIEVFNDNSSALTNYIVDVNIANVGVEYSAVDSNSNTVEIAGITSNGELTDSIDDWDTNKARLIVPNIPANSSELITLTVGNFTDPSTMTGNSGASIEPVYKVNPTYIPFTVVKLPTVPPNSTVRTFLYEDSNPSPSISSYDLPLNIPMYKLKIINLSSKVIEDAEIQIDVEEVTSIFSKIPFRVFNQNTLEMYETIPINTDNSYPRSIDEWDGKYIEVKITSIPPEEPQILYLKIANFSDVDIQTVFPKYYLYFGLDGLYHFSNGSMVDSSGNKMHGTSYGTWSCADKNYHPYQAIAFDGDTSWAEIPMNIFGNRNTDYTISFWFNITNVSENITHPRHICYFDNSLEFKFGNDFDGYNLLVKNIQNNDVLSSEFKGDGWHHVVYKQVNNDATYLYIDGTLKISTNAYFTRNSSSSLWIGKGNATGNELPFFRGRFDEMRLYNRPLSDGEIEALFETYERNSYDLQIDGELTSNILTPSSRITSLVDIKSLGGTPLLIYKYFNVPETVIEFLT